MTRFNCTHQNDCYLILNDVRVRGFFGLFCAHKLNGKFQIKIPMVGAVRKKVHRNKSNLENLNCLKKEHKL